MRTVTVAICSALVGALVGAWIVHLSEGNTRLVAQLTSFETQVSIIPELGRRLNLCLVEKLEAFKAKDPEHTLIPGISKQ